MDIKQLAAKFHMDQGYGMPDVIFTNVCTYSPTTDCDCHECLRLKSCIEYWLTENKNLILETLSNIH